MKHLRAYLAGLFFGIAGVASATGISLFTGPQDLSQTWKLFNQQIGNYVSFSNPTFEMQFGQAVCYSGTSICIVLPDGTAAYIKTSATP